MKVISFKLWGDFAHFRRFDTTTSPLTYSIPPPSSLRGLIGAILGFSSSEYPEVFNSVNAAIGIKSIGPIRKTRLSINYLNTKDGAWITAPPKKDMHTQIRIEFLKNPAYVIYFSHRSEKIMEELKKRLTEHKPFYTPYLGISECIAEFKYIEEKEFKKTSGKVATSCAFRKEFLEKIPIGEGTGFFIERMPIALDRDRNLIDIADVIFPVDGNPIPVILKEAWQSDGEIIYLF